MHARMIDLTGLYLQCCINGLMASEDLGRLRVGQLLAIVEAYDSAITILHIGFLIKYQCFHK